MDKTEKLIDWRENEIRDRNLPVTVIAGVPP